MSDNKKYILSSLDNALSLLNLFFDKDEMSVTEIAERMGVNRSTAFRMLVTLENRGFLTKKENAKYRLGGKIFSLGQLAYTRMELISLIHPYLEKITRETRETSHLVIMDDTCHIIFIDKVSGSMCLKMETPVGLRLYAHLTAAGKSILAYKSDEFINQYIKTADFTPNTEKSIKCGDDLIKQLHKIRTNGYAVDDEETEIGLTCYSVPLLDAGRQPIGALSSSGPTTRMVANREKYINVLQDTIGLILEPMIY